MPFIGPDDIPGDPNAAFVRETPHSAEMSTIMGGLPGASYDVSLRFRGVVEQKTYIGGTNDGAYWQIGGTPQDQPPGGTDRWNVYKLEISSPHQVYYLNRGTSGQLICYAIDYTKTVQIDAGATVLLWASAYDDAFAKAYSIYHAISVSGVTNPDQPYDGQWINMDVVSIAPH